MGKVLFLKNGGGISLPTLTNEATSDELLVGKELINSKGEVLVGTGDLVELNFKIVAYASEDLILETADENTIAVITETTVSGYQFSYDQPDTAVEGYVWISSAPMSPVQFNALKENGIVVYPVTVYQYISGAWIQKTAKSYINGAWREWNTYLFNNGVLNDDLTGGITGTIQGDAIYFYGTVDASYNQTYTTVNTVDLTGISAIKAVITSPNTFEDGYFRLLVDETQSSGGRVVTSNLVASRTTLSPFVNEVREVILDVSSLNGRYYLGYAWGVDSSAESAKTITGYIQRWWIE